MGCGIQSFGVMGFGAQGQGLRPQSLHRSVVSRQLALCETEHGKIFTNQAKP